MKSFYHVWFSTKGREPVLDGELAEDVGQLLLDTAKSAEIDVLEVEVALDQAHMLLAVNEGQDLSSIVHQLKDASALWQEGYGYRRIAPSELPTLRRYFYQLSPLLYR